MHTEDVDGMWENLRDDKSADKQPRNKYKQKICVLKPWALENNGSK